MTRRNERSALLAIHFVMAGACTHPGSGPPAGPASGSGGDRDEVVRFCIDKAMPAALAEVAPQLGPPCDASAHGIAGKLFEAGARIGVTKGTARVHAAGLHAAAEQLQVAADVIAKIADRSREEEQKVARTADEDSAKAVERIAGGTCVPAAVARALVDDGSRCAASAFDTEQYEEEYARAFGAVCEHQLSATECSERAQAEYPRMPRGEAPDAGR
jgi:hypothetical protein